jgi:hypothetical protein
VLLSSRVLPNGKGLILLSRRRRLPDLPDAIMVLCLKPIAHFSDHTVFLLAKRDGVFRFEIEKSTGPHAVSSRCSQRR